MTWICKDIWFTSDTHFGHDKIIEYCKRPFVSVEEMNEEMIKRWNEKVKIGDIVYHVGDFAFLPAEEGRVIRNRLNGAICLIEGNHDDKDYGFQWMKPYYELKIDEKTIVLFHYGMRTWRHDIRGAYHLYGHSHGQLEPYGKSFDVGVDCWNFYPLSWEEVKAKMKERKIGNHPQFENFTVNNETKA